MKQSWALILTAFLFTMGTGCAPEVYTTNGESIFKSGANLSGKSLLDRQKSQITIFRSCYGCHGRSGTRIRNCNIQWTYLTNPSKMKVPYTKELFYRFIDHDVKSDGSQAATGVHWNLTTEEKDDLIDYLKKINSF